MFRSQFDPKKAFYSMLILAGFFLVTGCGFLNQYPLAPAATGKPQTRVKSDSKPGIFAITFSPNTLNPATRATKPSGGGLYTKTDSGGFFLKAGAG